MDYRALAGVGRAAGLVAGSGMQFPGGRTAEIAVATLC
jgi:hypothetical protein